MILVMDAANKDLCRKVLVNNSINYYNCSMTPFKLSTVQTYREKVAATFVVANFRTSIPVH